MQYAHARINSILAATGMPTPKAADCDLTQIFRIIAERVHCTFHAGHMAVVISTPNIDHAFKSAVEEERQQKMIATALEEKLSAIKSGLHEFGVDYDVPW